MVYELDSGVATSVSHALFRPGSIVVTLYSCFEVKVILTHALGVWYTCGQCNAKDEVQRE